MTKLDFQVSGMHCQSCELLVKDEISSVKDVESVDVDHKTGLGSVKFTNGYADREAVLKAIENAGYKAIITSPQETTNQVLEGEFIINYSEFNY